MLRHKHRKVLLVGWDAADWKIIHPLMDEGKMPCLQQLVEQGSMANLATQHPVLSPMLWTSIATGKHAYKHGIHGFAEPLPDGSGVRPVTSLSRTTKAIWNIFSQEGITCNVVGWWPSHPTEPIRGAMVSNHFQQSVGPPNRPWPVPPGSVHPSRIAEPLSELRLHPNELLAEHILPFIPRAAEINQKTDCRLATCAKILAECTTVHAAATWLMQNEQWDFTAVYFDAIDHFCHAFMPYHPPRQPQISENDFELYHGVIAAAYRYHDMMLQTLIRLAGPDAITILVSDHGFHSDHLRRTHFAFEPAGPAAEHRDLGIFVIHGPGIRRDALLHGLTILDVAPTLLALSDLPVGADMDGRPALEAFEQPPDVSTIPSWDAVPGDAGTHSADVQIDAAGAYDAIQQLIALGYIEPLDSDQEVVVANTVRELRYNLARAYMHDNQHEEAANLLEELYKGFPHDCRFGLQLSVCYRVLNRVEQLRTIVNDLTSRRQEDARVARVELNALWGTLRAKQQTPAGPQELVRSNGMSAVAASGEDQPNNANSNLTCAGEIAAMQPASRLIATDSERLRIRELRSRAYYNRHAIEYLQGCLNFAEGHYETALEHLLRAESPHAPRPGLLLQIGEVYLRMGAAADAERSFRQAAEIDPENPHAHLGLCRAFLVRRQHRRAADAALKAIGLLYHFPAAHYYLGVALHRMSRINAAVDALNVAVSLHPNFAEAHERLATIFRRRLLDPDAAGRHENIAWELRNAVRSTDRSDETRSEDTLPVAPLSSAKSLAESTSLQAVDRPGITRTRGNKFHAARKRSEVVATVEDPGLLITVVTGLPRSGTSMVMQMLAAGGLSILTDDRRIADAFNPRGYFEYNRVKKLRVDNAWLAEACGRGIKIITPLVPYLPPQFHYRVLFIERDLDEVLASQREMLAESSERPPVRDDILRRAYSAQVRRARSWLGRQSNVKMLSVNHRDLIESSAAQAVAIAAFLPCELDAAKMSAVIEPSLSHHFAITGVLVGD